MKAVYRAIAVCLVLMAVLAVVTTSKCSGTTLVYDTLLQHRYQCADNVYMYGTTVPQGGTTDIGVHEYVVPPVAPTMKLTVCSKSPRKR